ncbi:MAG: hypothetical protein KJO40_18300 [Deltaproteobacteria bacterium]|nr:hypothetical protein [Deltaproteobacteria bacterium]
MSYLNFNTKGWSLDCNLKRWPEKQPVAPEAVEGFIADNKDLFRVLQYGAWGLWFYGHQAKKKKLKNIGMAATFAFLMLSFRAD